MKEIKDAHPTVLSGLSSSSSSAAESDAKNGAGVARRAIANPAAVARDAMRVLELLAAAEFSMEREWRVADASAQ